MKRLIPIVLATCAYAGAAHALEGAWRMSTDAGRPGRLHLQLTYGRSNNSGTTYQVGAFAGLTAEQVRAAEATPVRFALAHEAGRIDFDGAFAGGKGSGTFTFAPSPGYLDTVRALGVNTAAKNRSETRDERLLLFALLDLSTEYIRGLIAEGYREPLDEYLTMRIFDVTPEYIRSTRAAGFGVLSADQLVASRIHGVTPEFRAEMEQLGYRLGFDNLMAFRIHGVTAEWIDEMRKLGFGRLDADDLVATRIFEVTPAFIRSVRDAGYRNVPMSELISMRMRGIDAGTLARRRAI